MPYEESSAIAVLTVDLFTIKISESFLCEGNFMPIGKAPELTDDKKKSTIC